MHKVCCSKDVYNVYPLLRDKTGSWSDQKTIHSQMSYFTSSSSVECFIMNVSLWPPHYFVDDYFCITFNEIYSYRQTGSTNVTDNIWTQSWFELPESWCWAINSVIRPWCTVTGMLNPNNLKMVSSCSFSLSYRGLGLCALLGAARPALNDNIMWNFRSRDFQYTYYPNILRGVPM